MTSRTPSVRITCHELQNKFNGNEGGYPAKIESLRCNCIYDELASPRSKQPLGTRSKVYKYFDGETSVMVLHCFVLRSGELGASGKMDPNVCWLTASPTIAIKISQQWLRREAPSV
jgi:hypothetical protein